MTNIRDLFAKNMKLYRTAQGLTQANLAEKANTSTNYISDIENKSKFPSPKMMERIAFALGVDTTDLFIKEKNRQDGIKTYRKAVKDIKTLISRVLDEKLANFE